MMTDSNAPQEALSVSASTGFAGWLAATGGSLAFTTYQAGKLFLVGARPDGQLSMFERTFQRAMGLARSADGRTLALASQYQIQRFDNIVSAGQVTPDGYDALYAPHAGWVTGDLDVHDMGFGANGRPVFVNTVFNCIATVADGHSFRPLWHPSFVSQLVAEDRCHLNGMAMDAGRPAYVTAVSRCDVLDGWRGHRRDGGVVIDVGRNAIVCDGLSMPHSPRLHGGRLWVLNSGRGEFGWVDISARRFEPVTICPGYARGLTFVGEYAVVGLSLARDNRAFDGLELDGVLADHDITPRCGLIVIDLASGAIVHWLWMTGPVRELYDVVALPGVQRPSAIGFKTDEVMRMLSIDDRPME